MKTIKAYADNDFFLNVYLLGMALYCGKSENPRFWYERTGISSRNCQ
jgi:hypothetical protein